MLLDQIQLIMDTAIEDAVLFDEAAESLLGIAAPSFHRLCIEFPTLPELLRQLISGLHVCCQFIPSANRRQQASSYKVCAVLLPISLEL